MRGMQTLRIRKEIEKGFGEGKRGKEGKREKLQKTKKNK